MRKHEKKTEKAKIAKFVFRNQGCQIFLETVDQNGVKYTKLPLNYQMALKCTKWSKSIPAFSIPRPSKMYPNRDFWYENIPSGNPFRNRKEVFETTWGQYYKVALIEENRQNLKLKTFLSVRIVQKRFFFRKK
jgi:hypothetical protein